MPSKKKTVTKKVINVMKASKNATSLDYDKIAALLALTQYKYEDPNAVKKRVVKKKVPVTVCKTCGYKKTPATSMMCHLCNSQL